MNSRCCKQAGGYVNLYIKPLIIDTQPYPLVFPCRLMIELALLLIHRNRSLVG